MMKTTLTTAVISAGLVWMLAIAAFGGGDEGKGLPAAGKKQTTCPIMGGAVKSTIYADADGKRVYFCCGGCPPEFKKDPAGYIAKMEKAGIVLDKTPAAPAAPAGTNSPAPAGCACCQ